MNIPKLPLIMLFLLSLFSLPYLLTLTTTSTSPALHSLTSDLRMRRTYPTYESYVTHQLKKTLNPKLRKVWTSRDWERKVRVFSTFFSSLMHNSTLKQDDRKSYDSNKATTLLSPSSKCLCIGARVGQEVEALHKIGVHGAIGIDLVPYPPLVVKGDFHHQPFGDNTFDFEFSNVFDHALYPEKFVSEIERTLKVGGVCVLHVSINKRADKYSANDLFSVKPLVGLFKRSKVVHVRSIDGFGLDTEVVFRKIK